MSASTQLAAALADLDTHTEAGSEGGEGEAVPRCGCYAAETDV
ncbi:hypothetical protein [Streptomyces axinellae]|uniref:Uncharacterized protein n=1 Tax=Streptomyces axinellae TaxID=552788 RepID=A0ABP6CDV4_9ACTN